MLKEDIGTKRDSATEIYSILASRCKRSSTIVGLVACCVWFESAAAKPGYSLIFFIHMCIAKTKTPFGFVWGLA